MYFKVQFKLIRDANKHQTCLFFQSSICWFICIFFFLFFYFILYSFKEWKLHFKIQCLVKQIWFSNVLFIRQCNKWWAYDLVISMLLFGRLQRLLSAIRYACKKRWCISFTLQITFLRVDVMSRNQVSKLSDIALSHKHTSTSIHATSHINLGSTRLLHREWSGLQSKC